MASDHCPPPTHRLPLVLLLLFLLMPASSALAQFATPDASKPAIDVALNATALQPGQQAVVAVVLDVPEGNYAQADTQNNRDLHLIPLKVAVDAGESATVYETIAPEPHQKELPGVGTADIHDGRFVLYVPVQVSNDAAVGEVAWEVSVTYQICNKVGVCYPPTTEKVPLDAEVVGAGQTVDTANADLFADFDPAVWATLTPAGTPAETPAASTTDTPERSTAVWLIVAFFAGIVFNVVPCVLPVLPLKIMGFFEAAKHDRARCVTLSLFFAMGMIAVFALLGLLLFVTKQIANWGELFGNVWFAGAITLVLVIAAIGTLGFFSTGLPGWVYRFSPKHETFGGNVAWGAFTAVLSTPCTFGLFAGALAWAGSQPAWLGVLTLVIVGCGMAFPYVVLSFFPELARKFPRTGGWPEAVKQAMAFVLLAVAAFFARPLLPDAIDGDYWWWVVYGFLAVAGIWLVVRGGMLSHWKPMPVAIVAAIVVVLLIPTGVYAYRFANPPVGWIDYSDAALAEALGGDGPVLIDFTADWCGNCKTIEARVFGTQEQLDRWRDEFGLTLIRADLTDMTGEGVDKLVELNPSKSIPFTAVYIDGKVKKLVGSYGTGKLETALGR